MSKSYQKQLDRLNAESEKIYNKILELPGIEKTKELLKELDIIQEKRQKIFGAIANNLDKHHANIRRESQAIHEKLIAQTRQL